MALAAPVLAQDNLPARKRWWQDLDGSRLAPFGDWDVYVNSGLRIDNDALKTRLKLNATLFGDAGFITENDALQAAFPGDTGWNAAITQARLTLLGWVFDQGMFKLQLEFAEQFQIKDSWFRFNPLPAIGRVTAGNMKEPFSLGELSSSGDLTFMSDALPVLAFAPGRNIGIMARNAVLDGRMTWAFGGFWNTGSYADFAGAKDAFSNANGFDVTTRITGLPVFDHAGGAGVRHGVRAMVGAGRGDAGRGPHPGARRPAADRRVHPGQLHPERRAPVVRPLGRHLRQRAAAAQFQLGRRHLGSF